MVETIAYIVAGLGVLGLLTLLHHSPVDGVEREKIKREIELYKWM